MGGVFSTIMGVGGFNLFSFQYVYNYHPKDRQRFLFLAQSNNQIKFDSPNQKSRILFSLLVLIILFNSFFLHSEQKCLRTFV